MNVPRSDPRRLRLRRNWFLAVAVGALLTLLASESRAEQFVLFDATFTYTWDDAVNARPSKSHYYVNEGNWLNKQRPANWMTPVDYRDGKVHIRAEVLEKPPGTQQAGWALCYVANVGDYGCPYTDYYKTVGVYEKDVDMHTFYNNTTIQWDRGVKQVDLVYTVNGSGSGHITNFPDLKDLVTPTKVRITMVQVSMGATYDPSVVGASKPAVEPARDGGGLDAVAETGGPSGDASAASEAGGSPTGAAGAAGAGGGSAGTAGGAAGTTAPVPVTGAAGTVGGGAAGTNAPPSAGGPARGSGGGCAVGGGDLLGGGPFALALLVGATTRRRRRRIG